VPSKYLQLVKKELKFWVVKGSNSPSHEHLSNKGKLQWLGLDLKLLNTSLRLFGRVVQDDCSCQRIAIHNSDTQMLVFVHKQLIISIQTFTLASHKIPNNFYKTFVS
jgi:hypothetical protein